MRKLTHTERYPLDFDLLQRGSYLAPEEVERAVSRERSDPGYRLAQMGLAAEIRRYFQGKGDWATVVCDGAGLRVLTHPEQAAHAPARERRAVHQLLIAQVEGRAVDQQQLGDEQRERHKRWKLLSDFRLQQYRKTPPPELTA